MMYQDLREALPLWSLDRRGDGPGGISANREAVGALYAFGCARSLGEPLEMAPEMAPVRRASDRATTDRVTPRTIIRRILAVMRLRRARVRSRQQLKELDNHLLKDIGLRREAVDYTSAKPEMHWG